MSSNTINQSDPDQMSTRPTRYSESFMTVRSRIIIYNGFLFVIDMSVNCFPDLDILDNSLDGIDPREKNKKLKSLNKDIKDGYDKLETLGNKPYDGDNGLEFKDRRVYELYALARRSNMTQEELQSFMVGLQ